MRTMVAGSVRRRLAMARTLISTNSRGRSKAGRIICCRFGLRRLMRDDGLITGTERATFRGFLMGHKSMVESAVLVNTSQRLGGRCPHLPSRAKLDNYFTPDDSGAALRRANEASAPTWVVVDRWFAGCV